MVFLRFSTQVSMPRCRRPSLLISSRKWEEPRATNVRLPPWRSRSPTLRSEEELSSNTLSRIKSLTTSVPIRKMEEVKEAHDKLLGEFNEYQAAVTKTMKYNARIAKETAKLDELETPEVRSL